MQVFHHQRQALEEIISRARTYFAGHWHGFSIIPRWPSILVGPTGSGKTTIAGLAAKAVGASVVRVATPSWMPCGAHNRGTQETVTVIAEQVARNDRTLLVIDEVDKLLGSPGVSSFSGNQGGRDAWQSYIKSEIFEICDGRWPVGLVIPAIEDFPEHTLETLTEKLRTSVFILAIGTFQDYYDQTGTIRKLGFGGDTALQDDAISPAYIASVLPRELANRFHSGIVRLPAFSAEDYHRLARDAESKLPSWIRESFRAKASLRIEEAIEAQKGVRFVEDVMMEVLKELPDDPAQTTPQ